VTATPCAALGNTIPDAIDAADRIMHEPLFTNQEYLQYLWHAFTGLDVTGGIKFVRLDRLLDAPVKQKTMLALSYDESWTRNLPSLDVHYKFSDDCNAYAQSARAFSHPRRKHAAPRRLRLRRCGRQLLSGVSRCRICSTEPRSAA
jgi:hypothetical protein